MVHYEPSAQVPARRGGRAAGPTPAAGAASSAGRARARGRPAAFVGPPSRRAALAPVAAPRGESFPRRFHGPHVVEGEGVGSPRPALLPPHPRASPCSWKAAPVSGTCLRGCFGYKTRGCCGLVRLCWPAGTNELPQTSLQSGFTSPVPGGSDPPGAGRAGLPASSSVQESCVKVYYHEKHNAPRLH